MYYTKKIYFIILIIFIFTGCTQNNITNINPDKKIEKKKNKQIKKEHKKKIKKYKYCSKHLKMIAHASKYIEDEFDNAYFKQNDIFGAKAQMFLIENKSPSIFAKNINLAMASYKKHYKLAKNNACSIIKYKISPLKKVKIKIKQEEKKIENTN